LIDILRSKNYVIWLIEQLNEKDINERIGDMAGVLILVLSCNSLLIKILNLPERDQGEDKQKINIWRYYELKQTIDLIIIHFFFADDIVMF
jgi:hypothetical protein